MTGAELAEARHAAGVSQTAVANRVGVTQRRISNIEIAVAVTDAMAGRVLSAIAELTTTDQAWFAQLRAALPSDEWSVAFAGDRAIVTPRMTTTRLDDLPPAGAAIIRALLAANR